MDINGTSGDNKNNSGQTDLQSLVDSKKRVYDDVVVLFDLDGTLTPPRLPAHPEMLDVLKRLKKYVHIGIVTGSNEAKMVEQLHAVQNLCDVTDYIFPENGTVARLHGTPLGQDYSLLDFLGEEKLQNMIRFILHYIADLDIPAKRGTFIEYRIGVLNISPIGRNCSQQERNEFEQYDKIHGIRSKFASELRSRFSQYDLEFAIGGQISIDCYPKGWDKRSCLKHLTKFQMIHFFGDRTEVGGNDHEIYSDPRTVGHAVKGPRDTAELITQLFFK